MNQTELALFVMFYHVNRKLQEGQNGVENSWS